MSKLDAFLLGAACGFLSLFVIVLTVTIPMHTEIGAASIRVEATKSGHAEYVIVDPATGRTEFRWKDQTDG